MKPGIIQLSEVYIRSRLRDKKNKEKKCPIVYTIILQGNRVLVFFLFRDKKDINKHKKLQSKANHISIMFQFLCLIQITNKDIKP